MTNKFRRAGSIIILLLVVSLTTGCLGIFKKKEFFSLEVTWNKDFGNVVLPDNIDKIESGTVLEIKAEPNEGYAFKEWKGDGITDKNKLNNPLEIKVNKNMKIEAIFVSEDEIVTYALNIDFDENQVTIKGLPEDPSKVVEGTIVKLEAVPKDGFLFEKWTGDVPEKQATQARVEFVVNEDRDISIEIVEAPDPDLVVHTANFEGADTQGWANRGNLTVELSDKFARTGSKSLEVVPGDGGWLGGASVQLKDYIEAGVKYSFSGWLYHESETPIAVTMQAQYILDDGTEKGEEIYNWLHHIPEVPSGEWVKFEQELLVPENLRDDTFLFFFEIVNGDHKQNTFYLDDIMVVEVAE